MKNANWKGLEIEGRVSYGPILSHVEDIRIVGVYCPDTLAESELLYDMGLDVDPRVNGLDDTIFRAIELKCSDDIAEALANA